MLLALVEVEPSINSPVESVTSDKGCACERDHVIDLTPLLVGECCLTRPPLVAAPSGKTISLKLLDCAYAPLVVVPASCPGVFKDANGARPDTVLAGDG